MLAAVCLVLSCPVLSCPVLFCSIHPIPSCPVSVIDHQLLAELVRTLRRSRGNPVKAFRYPASSPGLIEQRLKDKSPGSGFWLQSLTPDH
jgi:hypothetical protein